MVPTTTGTGGDKGAEEQVPWQLTTALSQGKSWLVLVRACTLRPGMVLRDCVWLTDTHTPPFSPTHLYGHSEQSPHKEQNRQVKKAG
jgi:hypothetical protein